MKRLLLLAASHAVAVFGGFALGIYALPILIAPAAPTDTEVQAVADAAAYSGQFRKDLKGSDTLHWGEGTISVGADAVALLGRLAPGPDYKLYLTPGFVETEADFLRIKANAVRIGDVKTFENFLVPVPDGVDPARYDTAVVWCETFAEFITAAQYR